MTAYVTAQRHPAAGHGLGATNRRYLQRRAHRRDPLWLSRFGHDDLFNAVLQADYNLLMGTITISIIAVATSTLIIDLLYPVFDPRIRQK